MTLIPNRAEHVPKRPPWVASLQTGWSRRTNDAHRASAATAARLALIVSLLALVFDDVSAFDGSRTGFMLGGAVGVGGTSVGRQRYSFRGFPDTGLTVSSYREGFLGPTTIFRIGAGVSERVALYWTQTNNWFRLPSGCCSSNTIANGIGGLGLTFYTSAKAPSLFFIGAIGIATWARPFDPDRDTLSGLGVLGGVGYEFSRHWSVELALGLSTIKNPRFVSGDYDIDPTGLSLTISGLAY